jgi:hypothetical protein
VHFLNAFKSICLLLLEMLDFKTEVNTNKLTLSIYLRLSFQPFKSRTRSFTLQFKVIQIILLFLILFLS